MNLFARAYHRILKLARTIADLTGSEEIQSPHLAEALQYRPRLIYTVRCEDFIRVSMLALVREHTAMLNVLYINKSVSQRHDRGLGPI